MIILLLKTVSYLLLLIKMRFRNCCIICIMYFLKIYYEDVIKIEFRLFEYDVNIIIAQVIYMHYHHWFDQFYPLDLIFKGYVLARDIHASHEMTGGHQYREKASRSWERLSAKQVSKIWSRSRLCFLSSILFHFSKLNTVSSCNNTVVLIYYCYNV